MPPHKKVASDDGGRSGGNQIAYKHFKEGSPTWKRDCPEYAKAWSWEMLIVLSPINTETLVERDGVKSC